VSDTEPLVICVIVNWNGWQDTVECLTSLQHQDYANLQVIVVDNGSSNDSVRKIQEAHSWVTLVETGRNLGFSAGCNVGWRLAIEKGADYVWSLNNDTVSPADTLSKLVRKALANPDAGIIGSVLYYMHNPAQMQAWGGGRLNLWTGYASHFTKPTNLDGRVFFTGASILVPRRVSEDVGILFEGFFMYCDDSDLCLRIRQARYDLVLAEDTAILHKEGASSSKRSPIIDKFSTTSLMRLLKRQSIMPLISIGIFLLLRLTNRIRRSEWENLAAVWQGIVVYFTERKVVFRDRI
jgi:GT2 family glycosyltransferase